MSDHDHNISLWLPEGKEVSIDGPLESERQEELGELIDLIVVGAGPSLDIRTPPR